MVYGFAVVDIVVVGIEISMFGAMMDAEKGWRQNRLSPEQVKEMKH
jgi:hypothetical protein